MKYDKKKPMKLDRPWSSLASMLVEDMKIASKYGEENLGRRYRSFRCVIDKDSPDEPIHCTGITPEDMEPDAYNDWMLKEWTSRKWQSHSLHRPTRDQYRELMKGKSTKDILTLPIDDEGDEEEA